MATLLGKLKRLVWNQLSDRVVFRHGLRERVCKQAFFYNAFQVLSYNGIDGDYVEFGCHGGATFDLAYHEARRNKHKARLWAFDSFQGLPAPKEAKDDHPLWIKGEMATSLDRFHSLCADNGVPRAAYSVVPGFYEQTLPGLTAQDGPANIALAYIDCDLYSSTRTVLEFLLARMKHGMILAFDDYFCWSPTQLSGERRAIQEVLGESKRWELVPYRPFGWHGNSFFVEDRRIARPGIAPAHEWRDQFIVR